MTPHIPINAFPQGLLVPAHRSEELKVKSVDFPSLVLRTDQLCDLELLLNRAFYPLSGYLARTDYESVLESMQLMDGQVWPIPICLDVSASFKNKLDIGSVLALRDGEGFMLAVLHVQDIWKPDLEREARCIYGTDDPRAHPGVQCFYKRTGEWYLGGRVEGIYLPNHFDFSELRLSPAETQSLFARKGWRKIIGYTTNEFLHCSHKEMLLNAARRDGASILLHSLVSEDLLGNAEHFSRIRCCQRFIESFPVNMVHLGLLPLFVRGSGPRQALLEAIVQKNYCCTHTLIDEDRIDPFKSNDVNHPYLEGEALQVVSRNNDKLGLTAVPFSRMAYLEEKSQYVEMKTIADNKNIKTITTSELKRRLEYDLHIPEWFTLPEIVSELRLTYPPRSQRGLTLFITGLSGAGKSTLAKMLYVKFMEMRTRPVTLLDGDIVRKNLSSELNFSKEHRLLNIKRMGFVASEITKNRGIAICAPIAPYEEARRTARELVQKHGGFIEIYMSTPLEVCEQRDCKGIYAKARAGIMTGVTGIDDPYETPTDAEIVLDTTNISPLEGVQEVMLYLENIGYIV